MARNAARRDELVDAAIDLLAREGARGLTYRALDTEAGLPPGTASNYFRNRDELLGQAGRRIHHRLRPDAGTTDGIVADALRAPGRDAVVAMMRDLLSRIREGGTEYRALLELRLEATRRPGLRAVLGETIAANRAEDDEVAARAGLPGTPEDLHLLYLAMSGLIVEELTLPGAVRRLDPDAAIEALVTRLLPG